jgi:F-type H+-transporting ATPase subunit gamma
LIDKAEKMLESELSGKEVSFFCYGKRGRDWAKSQGKSIDAEYIGVVGGKIDFSVASGSGQVLIDSFLEGNVDEVYLIYSDFQGMAKQIPTVKQILPIPSLDDVVTEEAAPAEDGAFLPEHICEPSSDALLGEMLPKNIFIQIYDALLQTSTSEHAARMRAMENATKACSDLVDELQTIFNKTRQASITSELMDIVGGAEALKG